MALDNKFLITYKKIENFEQNNKDFNKIGEKVQNAVNLNKKSVKFEDAKRQVESFK